MKMSVGGRYVMFVTLRGALDRGCSCMKLGFNRGSPVLVTEVPVQDLP